MKAKEKLYIASCSFGKDSIATVLLALENNEPLDKVVFSEVMYDRERGISGEHPEHIKWVYEVAIPKLESMGVKVDVVRHPERDYLYYFHHRRTRGKNIGKKNGFPIGGMCDITKLKTVPIREYLKQYEDYDVIQYIGIAQDEPKRLARLKPNHISLLDKYGYTEDMAYKKAEEYGLLSPIYKHNTRNGCWFCPNSGLKIFARFRKEYPELWQELLELGKDTETCSSNFKYGVSIDDINKKLDKYETLL